jgi:hypothetical protein
MGARVIFNLKQSDGNYVCLYSHWGENTALEDCARAIAKARPRWGDESYSARMITSHIIGENWSDELNFGLWASNEPCIDEEWLVIDLAGQTVTARDGEHSFEAFVQYHGLITA